MNNEINITRLKGREIIPYIPELARLRISIFKEYPYLYDGNLDYERDYLETYVKCPESIIVLALDSDRVAGVSSAIPLEFETIEFQKPFLDNHIPLQTVFYFGESVLLPEYRGRNIYRHFFTQREMAAYEYGCKLSAFAAVERAHNDKHRPSDYSPLDSVWSHFGYKKHPELFAYYKWKEVGEEHATFKQLTFWLKDL